MSHVQYGITGFTVTFRTLVLSAFTKAKPAVALAPIARPVRPTYEVALASLPDRVWAAFTELPPNETEIRVIAALLRHPASTSAVLSAACGWSRPFWHTHFGLMCQRRITYLWRTDLPDELDVKFMASPLVDYRPNRQIFSFRPEVESVLRSLDVDWEI